MSSSESEDENLKRFAESVDTTIFSNNLYNEEKTKEKPNVAALKSQRNLEAEENVFQSEVNVSETMKKFIGNKLSKLIEDQVEFVELSGKEEIEDQKVDALRLLRGSKEVVKLLGNSDFVETRSKVPIKRRNIDSEVGPGYSEKIQRSAINSAAIMEETKAWTNKPKHRTFEYKNKKGIGYLKEPQNEFTQTRNKNNWSESKIKSAKLHNPPICDIIKR